MVEQFEHKSAYIYWPPQQISSFENVFINLKYACLSSLVQYLSLAAKYDFSLELLFNFVPSILYLLIYPFIYQCSHPYTNQIIWFFSIPRVATFSSKIINFSNYNFFTLHELP